MRDASNNLIAGVDSYTGMFYGSFSTGGLVTGTHTDAQLVGRRLLFFLPAVTSLGGPDVTLNSATGVITWNYPYVASGTAPPTPGNDTVVYGGY